MPLPAGSRVGPYEIVAPLGTAAQQTLVWVDRQGHAEPIRAAPARVYAHPRLSPDGTRVAFDIRDQQNDIWIWDLAREALTRLTFDPAFDRFPVWTPNGQGMLFGSARTGVGNIFRQAADGTGTAERLTQSSNLQYPSAISPDGIRLVFEEDAPTQDIMLLTLDKDRHVQPLVQTSFVERFAEISSDGRSAGLKTCATADSCGAGL